VYRTEIVVAEITLLSGRGEEGGQSNSGSYQQRGSSNTASFDQRPSGGDDYAHSTEITDDDIPF
jgi:single-stranded DNA-binding protein